ncbi:MAG: dodecin, partial [Hyphomicrobiaceae bacterium]
GSSSKSVEHAIETAVTKAGESLRGMRWFRTKEIRGQIDNNKIQFWQVTIEIGFTLEA